MLKKFALAGLAVSGLVLVAPQAAGAVTAAAVNEPCYLNCFWVEERDEDGNVTGGRWSCPGEEYECVSG